MLKKTLYFLQFIIPAGLGLLFIIYFLNKFEEPQKQEIITSFINAKYGWIWISIFIGVLSHFIRAIRWKYTLEPLGYYPKTHNLFFSVMSSYFANLAFPRLGEVVRCTTLAKYENFSFNKVLGTVIAERAVDILFLFIALILVLIMQGEKVSLFFNQNNISFFSSKATLKVLLLLSLLACITYLFLKKIKGSSNPFIIRLSSFFENLSNGLKSILIMKNKVSFIALTIFIWFLYVLVFYVCIFALPETSSLGLHGATTCFLFGAIAISITNGGLGAYPAFIAQAMVLYEISEAVGYASGWIVWTGQTIMIVVLGSISLILLPILNKKNA